MARVRGVPTTGSKTQLVAALRHHLDGRGATASAPGRPRPAPPLAEPLTRSTVLPVGQRCTQQLRHFCTAEVGRDFRFDAPVRAFVATSDGRRTVGDLLDHWGETRSREPSDIAPQFEFNRFLRRWHLDHPGAGRPAGLDAWWRHRALPVNERP